jgi:hypothetical protein
MASQSVSERSERERSEREHRERRNENRLFMIQRNSPTTDSIQLIGTVDENGLTACPYCSKTFATFEDSHLVLENDSYNLPVTRMYEHIHFCIHCNQFVGDFGCVKDSRNNLVNAQQVTGILMGSRYERIRGSIKLSDPVYFKLFHHVFRWYWSQKYPPSRTRAMKTMQEMYNDRDVHQFVELFHDEFAQFRGFEFKCTCDPLLHGTTMPCIADPDKPSVPYGTNCPGHFSVPLPDTKFH